MTDVATTPFDVADLLPCGQCGKGMMHAGDVSFYEVTIVQCVVDVRNVQRMHGMELMMGGAVGIARALSPDHTVARRVGAPTRRMVCQQCALMDPQPVALLLEDKS
jgi:hypothetical protein